MERDVWLNGFGFLRRRLSNRHRRASVLRESMCDRGFGGGGCREWHLPTMFGNRLRGRGFGEDLRAVRMSERRRRSAGFRREPKERHCLIMQNASASGRGSFRSRG